MGAAATRVAVLQQVKTTQKETNNMKQDSMMEEQIKMSPYDEDTSTTVMWVAIQTVRWAFIASAVAAGVGLGMWLFA